MSDHLDECPEVFIDCYGSSCDCDYAHICMCKELRACEARLLEGRPDPGISEKQAIANYAIYQNGYDAALDAAREAVAALPWKVAVSFGPIDCDESCEHGPCVCSGVMRPEAWMTGLADVLDAIAALREEKR